MTEAFLAATTTSLAELRYLALGDSYTIGEGVEPAGRWPVQLAAALRGEGIAVADPRIIATTGWTTDELDAGIDSAHDQAGILHWPRGAPVRLRMYRERPPGNRTGWVDWVHRPR